MKSRPIIMRADEVRAILDGRKTQFRRPVKWPVLSACDGSKRRVYTERDVAEMNERLETRQRHPSHQFCPHGQPGDRLWVRETWYGMRDGGNGDPCVAYAADNPPKPERCRWMSSIHMPRWASRITLEIVRVRVERVRGITEEDLQAEGCRGGHGSIPGYGFSATPREHFRHNWQSTHGTWDANPWVWVVEFRRVTK